MRFGNREENTFEKPEYDVQHRRGSMPSRTTAASPPTVSSAHVGSKRFVVADDRPDFDEYPDDRD